MREAVEFEIELGVTVGYGCGERVFGGEQGWYDGAGPVLF